MTERADDARGTGGLDDVALARAIARGVEPLGGRVYYVGGYVRDQVLGLPNKDVDVEVHGVTVDQLERVLEGLGSVSGIGASFGILSLKGHTLDIAVPRREGADRASLREGADPFLGTRKAALRRDLTMNALYQDVLTGEVIDHFGGLDDIRRGVIRHVDATSFAEDPLRVLRVAQFSARMGMDVDPATMALCATLDLSSLAPERVLEELRKAMLKSARPSAFFGRLRDMGQLSPWFAEVEALVGTPQPPMHHPEGDAWTHTMLVLDVAAGLRGRSTDPFAFMLAALCHDLGKAVTTTERDGRIVSYGHEVAGVDLAAQLLDRLGASTKVRAYVLDMVRWHMAPNAYVAQGSSQKSYNKLFDRSCCPADLLLLAKADSEGRAGEFPYEATEAELAERLRTFEEVMARPYVQGRDLVAMGVEPGPSMGEALRHAHKLRLAGVPKEDALRQTLGYVRKELGGSIQT